MTSDSIRIGRWIARTEAEGPGTRTAVWVQGCTIRCPGCFNPHLWGASGGTDYSPEALARDVPFDVEGVTLLGGEPFEQATALAKFAAIIQSRRQSVMTFTGYTREELEASHSAEVAALLDHTDLLVDGPFDQHDVDHARPWVGSRQQRFHALTGRYEDLIKELASIPDRVEVRISAHGRISLNGWATDDQLDVLLEGMRRETRRMM